MGPRFNRAISRRTFIGGGLAIASGGLAGVSAPAIAQTAGKTATKVLDFLTYADVAKAEAEGELVFYCHENEAGTAAFMEGFHKDFPKIKTSYVRAQTGALYNKIISERAAGRYLVDVMQLSDVAPAVDFAKKGGWETYAGPELEAYKKDYLSATPGQYMWMGVGFCGIGYNTEKVTGADIPKAWKDINDPKWRNVISAKISSSGLQFVEWYTLGKIYGFDFWKEFAKQKPKTFDSRVQLYDRLAKGEDKVCAIAEYAAHVLYSKGKNAPVGLVMPSDGVPATPLLVGVVEKAPHPNAARLYLDWAASKRGQTYVQNHPNLYYGSVRNDAGPMPTGEKLGEFKLLFPQDWDEYASMRDRFTKEWNAMQGL
ncbi:MAG: extracellular solute-binding protein [Proteobacteria bacterium]|nr:extracellular solute-binding protein [Pseudomonadota bacterium]